METLFHRRRDLPELKSSNFNLRSFGERVALNMPIQGTAADIMKLAMVAVRKRLAGRSCRRPVWCCKSTGGNFGPRRGGGEGEGGGPSPSGGGGGAL